MESSFFIIDFSLAIAQNSQASKARSGSGSTVAANTKFTIFLKIGTNIAGLTCPKVTNDVHIVFLITADGSLIRTNNAF